MKMYNTSLESFKVICDAKVFEFKPREYTEVPDNIADMLYNQVKAWGVFPIRPNITEEELKQAKFKALKDYLNGALRVRLECYDMQKDHYARINVTLPPQRDQIKAMNWQKEIHKVLELESPIEVVPSFLDEETRKAIGIDLPNVEHIKDKLNQIDQNIFSPAAIAKAEVKRAPGRPKKVDSFLDPEIEGQKI
jgi:hypothetical protein